MSNDLPEYLDAIVTGSLRSAVVDARRARRWCLSDGAAARAPGRVAEGDALLLDAERLIEQGEHRGLASIKLRAASRRYEQARCEAIDFSDGKCPMCRAKLRPVDDQMVLGTEEHPVIVHIPAARCDACAVTFGEINVCRVYREDHVVELMPFQVTWARPDRNQVDEEVDDGERLWVERNSETADECPSCWTRS